MRRACENYIKFKDCKDGYTYCILARNGEYGIYKEDFKAFTLIRLKWNDRYLFDEYHWDYGWGTVKPIKEIEKAPEFETKGEKFFYLDQLEKRMQASQQEEEQ